MKAKQSLLVAMTCLLAACASNPMVRVAPTRTAQGAVVGVVGGAVAGSAVGSGSGAVIGAVVGGVAGGLIGYDQQRRMTPAEQLREALRFHGATVINMGDNTLVSIPNGHLFYPNSPRIRWSSYAMLNLTADYLRQFPKVSVRVVGYTDNQHNRKRDMGLSRARAQKVANYLWTQNIDARLIYAQGYGQLNPIASNEYSRGREWNERIEVIFRIVRPPMV